MIGEGVFDLPGTVGLLPIAGVSVLGGYQRVALRIVVYLCAFELHLVYPDFFGKPVDVGYLVFVGAHHQKLKNDVWRAAFQASFPLHHTPGTCQHVFQLAADAVLFVGVLGSTVDGNNKPVQAGLHGAARVVVVQEMPVGTGDGIQAFLAGVGHHVEEPWIDVRFALKIKNEEQQVAVQCINGLSEKICFQVAGVAGKGPKPGGALRATQVAGRGGFHAYGYRKTPLHRSATPPGDVVGSQNLLKIPDAPRGEATD